jgi:hypothetical protein
MAYNARIEIASIITLRLMFVMERLDILKRLYTYEYDDRFRACYNRCHLGKVIRRDERLKRYGR